MRTPHQPENSRSASMLARKACAIWQHRDRDEQRVDEALGMLDEPHERACPERLSVASAIASPSTSEIRLRPVSATASSTSSNEDR